MAEQPPRTTRKTTLLFPGDLHKWLRIYAARWDTTFQDVVERAVTDWATRRGFVEDGDEDAWQFRREG